MKKKQELFAPVWRHWKNAFLEYRWLFIGTTLLYGTSTYLNDVYKITVWKRIIDCLSEHKNPMSLFVLIPIIGIVSWFFNRSADHFLARGEANIIRYLKNYAFQRILNYDTNFFLNAFVGSIVSDAKKFATTTESVYDQFQFTLLRVFVILSGVFIVSLKLFPFVGFILIGWAFVFGLMTWYFLKKRTSYDKELTKADTHTAGVMNDIVGSIHMIHSYTREKEEYVGFEKTTDSENKERLKTWMFGNYQWAVQAIWVLLLEIFLMYFVIQKAIHGEISIGSVVLAQSFVASVSSYMWSFGKSLTAIRTCFAEASEMSKTLNEKEENQENEINDFVSIEEVKNYDINFSNVSFSYPNRNVMVLKEISFDLKAGKRYGMVGRTGSGKTTITRLLLKQFNIAEGCISIGGISISQISKYDFLRLISYVPQDPHFPFRTVREIISFGKPGASKEEIVEAAKKAACHDFIMSDLENGYETLVGERGVKLSGGQRQRLAIAAAFLRDAPIFIFDEPTSALDSETEEVIQKVLKDMEGKTMIVIAHRLSTVSELDEIIVLENGNIKEKGTHSELLEKKNGVYNGFWKKQFHLD